MSKNIVVEQKSTKWIKMRPVQSTESARLVNGVRVNDGAHGTWIDSDEVHAADAEVRVKL